MFDELLELIKDVRKDVKTLINLFKKVDLKELIVEMRRFNDIYDELKSEGISPSDILHEIRQLNDLLSGANLQAIAELVKDFNVEEIKQALEILNSIAKKIKE